MVLDFFRWWAQQLAALVPVAVRQHFSTAKPRLVLVYSAASGPPGIVDVTLQTRTGSGALGRFRLDVPGLEGLRTVAERAGPALETVLELPQHLMLEKRLVLPMAAQRDLARIVEYEIDHETPFQAAEIYWSIAGIAKDRSLNRLSLRLFLLLKRDVDPLLEALRGVAIFPAAIIDTDMDRRIRLRQQGQAGSSRFRLQGAGHTPILAATALGLAIVAIAGPFLRQSAELAAVDDQIIALQPDADAADALRRQVGGAVGPDLGDPQTNAGNPLRILAAVTEALPDDSYLSDFTEHHREITLIGQSAAAAVLIQRLSDEPMLKDPAFSAPVTRDPGTNADSFAIKLSLKQS